MPAPSTFAITLTFAPPNGTQRPIVGTGHVFARTPRAACLHGRPHVNWTWSFLH